MKVFLLFAVVNLILYGNILLNHDKIPFNFLIYKNSAHHFLKDPRVEGGPFLFLRALGQMDAQWYLKIASDGYPKNPSVTSMDNKNIMDGLTYAFFPLYPLVLFLGNILIGNLEFTAFIIANVLITGLFFSFYYIINKLYSLQIAIRTVLLLFVFPFSIFFRSYYTEGLFLLLLLWFSFFILKKHWFWASLIASLLYVTRPNGLFLIPFLFLILANEILHRRIGIKRVIVFFVISEIPFVAWLIFNFLNTGDPMYWMAVQQSWFITPSLFDTIRYNLTIMAHFFQLPFHDFNTSRLDTIVFLYSGFLVYSSRKFLKKELWWLCFILWLFPLLVHNSMSYSRYQSVNFPLFIYAASHLKGVWFVFVCIIFLAFLLLASLFFVNWHWVG